MAHHTTFIHVMLWLFLSPDQRSPESGYRNCVPKKLKSLMARWFETKTDKLTQDKLTMDNALKLANSSQSKTGLSPQVEWMHDNGGVTWSVYRMSAEETMEHPEVAHLVMSGTKPSQTKSTHCLKVTDKGRCWYWEVVPHGKTPFPTKYKYILFLYAAQRCYPCQATGHVPTSPLPHQSLMCHYVMHLCNRYTSEEAWKIRVGNCPFINGEDLVGAMGNGEMCKTVKQHNKFRNEALRVFNLEQTYLSQPGVWDSDVKQRRNNTKEFDWKLYSLQKDTNTIAVKQLLDQRKMLIRKQSSTNTDRFCSFNVFMAMMFLVTIFNHCLLQCFSADMRMFNSCFHQVHDACPLVDHRSGNVSVSSNYFADKKHLTWQEKLQFFDIAYEAIRNTGPASDPAQWTGTYDKRNLVHALQTYTRMATCFATLGRWHTTGDS